MFIEKLPDDPVVYYKGVFQYPWDEAWYAVLEVDGEAYDLGKFGNFAEAGAAYLKAKQALEEVGCTRTS